MKELILHIGYPKAGSSALQTTLLASRAGLRDRGFFFPNTPKGICNALTARFHPPGEMTYPYYEIADPAVRRVRIADDWADLTTRLAGRRGRRVILSSESLIGLEQDEVLALAEWARSLTDRVTVVCYVRHPIGYATSLAQEQVRQGGSLPGIGELVSGGEFSHLLPRWETAFGRASMIVRPLDPAQLEGGEIVADFARLIGYDGPIDRSETFENRGMSLNATLALSAIHGLDEPLRSEFAKLLWLRRTPGPPFRLPAEALARVRAASEPELAYLADHWGVKLPEPAPLEDGEVFGREAADYIARRLSRLIRLGWDGVDAPSRPPRPERGG